VLFQAQKKSNDALKKSEWNIPKIHLFTNQQNLTLVQNQQNFDKN
jgi:hypothetical protein